MIPVHKNFFSNDLFLPGEDEVKNDGACFFINPFNRTHVASLLRKQPGKHTMINHN